MRKPINESERKTFVLIIIAILALIYIFLMAPPLYYDTCGGYTVPVIFLYITCAIYLVFYFICNILYVVDEIDFIDYSFIFEPCKKGEKLK